jgi:hypothetical protein
MEENEYGYYEGRLDKIFGKGSTWPHRTFRTIFDPFSSEWEKTSYDKKLEILEKAIAGGEILELLIGHYKKRYIASCVDTALGRILEYSLSRKSEPVEP